jgi:hypothetical protein
MNVPPATTTQEGETTRTTILNVTDAKRRSGDSHVLALAAVEGLGANRAQVRGVEHVIEMMIDHASYGKDLVDITEVQGSTCGKRIAIALRGVAAVQHRGAPGRFLVSYDIQVFVGVKGAFLSYGKRCKKIKGWAATSNWTYFGGSL